MLSPFNVISAKQRRRKPRSGGKMRSTTIREFGGGWNVIDAPAALSTKYASVLKNWYRKQDGSQSIRYGTKLIADISDDFIAPSTEGTWFQGNQGAQAFGDGVVNSKSAGFKFRPANTGTIGSVTLEVTSVTVAGNYRAALYTHNVSNPGTPIGVASDVINITAPGNITFTFPTPPSVTGLTDYWIVITDQGATGDVTFRTVLNQGGNIGSGKHDDPMAIADDQLSSSEDWKVRVTVLAAVTGQIVDMRYFNGRIVVVTDEGEVITIDGSGNTAVIWNSSLAALLPGSPAGWSSGLDFISFAEIKGSLTIHNGIDKPIEVQSTFVVRYLQDLATGSNVNVPIGLYSTTVADYLCIAGVPAEPNVVYIASKGTVAVFPGDPPPNDSLAFDVGAYAPEENQQIRGISSFRNYLFVHFLSATVQVILGEYNAAVDHVPRVGDVLPKFGLLSHRAAIPVVNDLLFPDVSGVNTIRRNVLSNAVEPDRLSNLIAPEFQKQVALLTQDEMLTDIFGVHDRLSGHYMVFVPDGELVRTFVLTFNERMRIKAWSEFVDWTWIAATSSALGRVFFAKDTRVYQYGNEAYNEEYSADLIGEYDGTWANNTAYVIGDRLLDPDDGLVYVVLVDHTSAVAGTFAAERLALPTLWEEYEGEEINFDWEFPWTDVNSRARIKRLANILFDTQGTSQFTVDVFVDNIYLDASMVYDPAVTFVFTGGDSPGYGGGNQPYGGGRRTSDERLWSHPVKFKIMKPRIYGSTKLPLRVVALGFLFAEGKYGR